MIVFRPLLGFFLMLLFVSCGENKNTEEKEVMEEAEMDYQDPELAMGEWSEAWNSNDPQKIFDETADDVVLVMNGNEVPTDSIRGFLEYSGTAMQDLNMQSLSKGTGDKVAYDIGTFTHKFENDSTQYEGSYTFIWERMDDEADWKVTVMNISDKKAAGEPQQPKQ